MENPINSKVIMSKTSMRDAEKQTLAFLSAHVEAGTSPMWGIVSVKIVDFGEANAD